MSTVISIKVSGKMYLSLIEYVQDKGYDSIEDFIKEVLREKLYEEDNCVSRDLKRINSMPKSEKVSDRPVDVDMIDWSNYFD